MLMYKSPSSFVKPQVQNGYELISSNLNNLVKNNGHVNC